MEYNIDTSMLGQALPDKTKPVMLAYTLGNSFDLKELNIRMWKVIDKVVLYVMRTIFKTSRKEYTLNMHIEFMQFVKFSIVGVSNVIVSYVIYVTCLLFFRNFGFFPVWDYQIAQALGFFISVSWAFCLNRKIVFMTDGTGFWGALAKFYFSYAFTGLFLNAVLLHFWKSVGISEFIAPFINIFVTTPINFMINKLWTFRKNRA